MPCLSPAVEVRLLSASYSVISRLDKCSWCISAFWREHCGCTCFPTMHCTWCITALLMACIDLLILRLIKMYFAAHPTSSKAQRISRQFSAALPLAGQTVLKTQSAFSSVCIFLHFRRFDAQPWWSERARDGQLR